MRIGKIRLGQFGFPGLIPSFQESGAEVQRELERLIRASSGAGTTVTTATTRAGLPTFSELQRQAQASQPIARSSTPGPGQTVTEIPEGTLPATTFASGFSQGFPFFGPREFPGAAFTQPLPTRPLRRADPCDDLLAQYQAASAEYIKYSNYRRQKIERARQFEDRSKESSQVEMRTESRYGWRSPEHKRAREIHEQDLERWKTAENEADEAGSQADESWEVSKAARKKYWDCLRANRQSIKGVYLKGKKSNLGILYQVVPMNRMTAGIVGGAAAASLLGLFGDTVRDVATYAIGGLAALTAVTNLLSDNPDAPVGDVI